MTDAAGAQRVEDVMKRWRALSDDDPWRDDVEVLYARLQAVEAERNAAQAALRDAIHDCTANYDDAQRLTAEVARLTDAAGILADPDKRHWKEEWSRQIDRAKQAEARGRALEAALRVARDAVECTCHIDSDQCAHRVINAALTPPRP